jgi:DNA polymerase-3 subunit alpha (Gram-positive type)
LKDNDVLKRSPLCEAFKDIIPADRLRTDFSKAFITNLHYDKKGKKIELCLEADCEIAPGSFRKLEEAISGYFNVSAEIRPNFLMPLPGKLSDWHRDIITYYTCRDRQHLKPFLQDSEYLVEGRKFIVKIPSSVASMLDVAGVGKHMEDVLRMLFCRDFRVVFAESADDGKKAVDYLAEKMETEARMVAEVLSKPNGDKPHKEKKSTGTAAAGRSAAKSRVEKENAKGYVRYRKESVKKTGAGGKGGSENLVCGRPIKGEPMRMADVYTDSGSVVISGKIIKNDIRELKSGRTLFTFDITDRTWSITCKVFPPADELERFRTMLAVGRHVRVNGTTEHDDYARELAVRARDIECIEVEESRRMDNAPVKRVELHLHTQMSQLDAACPIKDVIRRAAEWGHKAIAITDHGVVQAYPDAQDTAEKLKKENKEIKIIYGMEAYIIAEERFNSRGELDYRNCDTNHAVILVKNQTGLKNLYKIVSESHLNYFYKKPRVPISLFEEYREGLMIGSACEQGELFRAVLNGRSEEEIEAIALKYDYLEIQPTGNNAFLVRGGQVADDEALKDLNRRIVSLGEKLNKPVVATCDVHFLDPDDAIFREILQAGQGYKDADRQAPIFFRTTDEMLEEFSYLGEEKAYEVVVTNPGLIADSIEYVRPIPDGTYVPLMDGAEDIIKQMSERKVAELYGDPLPEIVKQRVDRELNSIIKNGFSVLYIIAQKLVAKSLEDGYLVGSRGSVGSSFVAYLIGITEVNSLPAHYRCGSCKYSEFYDKDKNINCGFDLPDKDCPVCGKPLIKDGYDIPFEVFLGFDGDKEPDIDLNFSGEYQSQAHKYTEELFGKGYTFRAGTISTIADKTAYGFAKKYLEEKQLIGTRAEIERLASGCIGTKRTTGQHPGGVMVVPRYKEIYDFTPIQRPADDTNSDIITTHFDYHSISGRILKLDILGHDDPTVIRMLADITGVDPKTIPIGEKRTMGIFSGTEPLGVTPQQINSLVGTFGVPEFGTRFVRQMLVETMPTTFGELIRISGLSHGENVWANNAQDLVRAGTITLSDVISTRDDIMIYLMKNDLPPLKAFKIMEDVRKGKGLKPEYEELMVEKGIPDWYIDSCKKIKYMFPKAHAAAYVMMAFRIAWFKVYYPEAFYATYFSVRADTFDANIISKGPEAVRRAIEDIERRGNSATQKEKDLLTILEVAQEMYARGIRCLPVDLYKSDAMKFIITKEGILPPLTALQGLGAAAANNIVQSRQHGEYVSIEDLKIKSGISKAVIDILAAHGCLDGLEESSQLSLF